MVIIECSRTSRAQPQKVAIALCTRPHATALSDHFRRLATGWRPGYCLLLVQEQLGEPVFLIARNAFRTVAAIPEWLVLRLRDRLASIEFVYDPQHRIHQWRVRFSRNDLILLRLMDDGA